MSDSHSYATPQGILQIEADLDDEYCFKTLKLTLTQKKEPEIFDPTDPKCVAITKTWVQEFNDRPEEMMKLFTALQDAFSKQDTAMYLIEPHGEDYRLQVWYDYGMINYERCINLLTHACK